MQGTVTGLTDASCTDEDCSPESIQTHDVPDAKVDFPWFEPNQNAASCTNGVCLVADASVTQKDTVTNEDVKTNYAGIAVSKPGFFSYQLIDYTIIEGGSGGQNLTNALPQN